MARAVRERRARLSVVLAAVTLLVLLAAPGASADLPPPLGFRWDDAVTIIAVNPDDFPDYVFITMPGEIAQETLRYRIVHNGDLLHQYFKLYALPTRDVRLRTYQPKSADERALFAKGNLPLEIVEPKLGQDPEEFFEKDPRVVRGFPEGSYKESPSNSGVQWRTIFVRIDRIDGTRGEGHVDKVKYTCHDGVELEQSKDERHQFPLCPVPDDHGEWIAPDGGPGATADAPPLPPPPEGERPRWYRVIQWGAIVASVSLLLGGILMRTNNTS